MSEIKLTGWAKKVADKIITDQQARKRAPGGGRKPLYGENLRETKIMLSEAQRAFCGADRRKASQAIRRVIDILRAKAFKVILDLETSGFETEKTYPTLREAFCQSEEWRRKYVGQGGSVEVNAILEGYEVMVEWISLNPPANEPGSD